MTSKVAKHPKRAKNDPPSRAIGRFSGFILLEGPFFGYFAYYGPLDPKKHPKEPEICPPLQGNRTCFGHFLAKTTKKLQKRVKNTKKCPPLQGNRTVFGI